MSFAGFVFDMIGRNKANRDLLNLRRERRKELLGKMCKTEESRSDLNITLAEFERIQKQTKEKQRQEQNLKFRNTCIFLALVVAVFFLLLVAIKLLF
ncbi:hypothetical protein [Bacteroides sp.]